jgi:hypothetical protein
VIVRRVEWHMGHNIMAYYHESLMCAEATMGVEMAVGRVGEV